MTGFPVRKIDDWLIDGVFQKVSDRLACFWSCYAIAGFLLTGSAVTILVSLIQQHDWLTIFVGSLWFPPRVREAYRLERQARTDVIPTERITGFPMRFALLLTSLLLFPVCLPLEFMDRAWWRCATDVALVVTIIGFYFMACRARPPKQQRQWMWAASEA